MLRSQRLEREARDLEQGGVPHRMDRRGALLTGEKRPLADRPAPSDPPTTRREPASSTTTRRRPLVAAERLSAASPAS
jgi:hypothetical protein